MFGIIGEQAAGAGWMPTSIAIVGVLLLLTYVVWRLALPKPIPGIPYNKESARRFLGDLPEFKVLEDAGQTGRLFWAGNSLKHNSAITQCFLGPFAKPSIIVSDFREAQDIMLRRGKDLSRGRVNRDAWHGIVPEHFIGMENDDKRYKDTKELVKDLMTPKFLHEVNCPASYQKVLDFIELWQQKAKIAEGHAFNATKDLSVLTYDIIMAAALGLNDDEQSEVVRLLHRLRDDEDMSSVMPDDENAPFPFPDPEVSTLEQSIHTIAAAAGDSFVKPSQRLYHYFNNRTAAMKKAHSDKKTILQVYVNRASQRLADEGSDFQPRSALDYIVSREAAMAKKADRAPVFESDRIIDSIFGYMVGGQDSTHSTLSFLVKRLGCEQESQKKLRDGLRRAHTEALARQEQPTIQDILKTPVPYLEAFIQESLRLSEPTMAISRDTLCDMEVLGHVVPKGTMLILCLSGPTFQKPGIAITESQRSESSQKHRDAQLHDWAESEFPGDKFIPERWLKPSDNGDGELVFNSQAGPFLTFSNGTRGCWGKRLAYLELKLVITLFVWNFVFEQLPAELDDWSLDDNLFLRPTKCHVRLTSAWE